MFKLLNPTYQNLVLGFSFCLFSLVAINSFNLRALNKAKEAIKTRDNIIAAQDQKIKDNLASAQFERAAVIDAINESQSSCAKSIKAAVDAANVKPAPNVFIATKAPALKTNTPISTIPSEVKTDETCQNSPNSIIISNAFSLRDIQAAGANNAN